MDEAAAAAREASAAVDPIVRARGKVAEADLFSLDFGPEAKRSRAGREEARAVLEDAGDDLGLAYYWRSRGYDFWALCRSAESGEAWERGIGHARAAGAERIEFELRSYVLSGLVLGPTPVSEALPRARLALEEAREGSLAEATAQRALGQLLACDGSVDEGRASHARGAQTYGEAGLLVTAAGWSMGRSEIEFRAGDPEARVRVLREGFEVLDALGDRFFFPTVAAWLAAALIDTLSPDDAEIASLCDLVRKRSIPGDLANFVALDWIEARLLARAGRPAQAEALARRALESADGTDHFQLRARSRLALAEVLVRAGRPHEAAPVAAEAVSSHVAKEDVTGAAVMRAQAAALGIDVD